MASPKPSSSLMAKYGESGLNGLAHSLPEYVHGRMEKLLRRIESELVLKRLNDNLIKRDDLRQIAKTRGDLWTYGDSERISIDYDSEKSLPESLRAHTGTFEYPQPFLTKIEDAKILWEGAPVLTEQGDVVLESVENQISILRHRIDFAIQRRGIRRVLRDIRIKNPHYDQSFENEKYFPLIRHPTTNFYHWMLEYLPKLQAFKHYQSVIGETPTLLLENNPPNWVDQSLQLMGCKPDDCVQWSNENTRIEELLIPQHRSRTPNTPNIPTPSECVFLKNEMEKRVASSEDSHKRIFISRQNARDRKIQNFNEVKTLLREYDFRKIELEEMAVSEQVSLFLNADFIVAPHGAGLSHLVFGDNLALIELFRHDQIRHHYFCISQMLGHNYQCMVNEGYGNNMKVNPQELGQNLYKMVNY